jgi:hypothetical protein
VAAAEVLLLLEQLPIPAPVRVMAEQARLHLFLARQ